ncbi:MAG: hypothetical protein HOP09_04810 [Hyphomicrobium sp.]|nr:hypothetical protein [Hyphomicrobium sp.]
MKLKALLLAIVSIAAISQNAVAQRMSERDGEGYLWGGAGKPPIPRIDLSHTDVIGVVGESSHVSLNPDVMLKKTTSPKFWAKATVQVLTRKALTSGEIEAVAAEVREKLSLFHMVGVRFVKAKGDTVQRDPEASKFYGWILFADGQQTIRNIMASSDALAPALSVAAKHLKEGEIIIGTWKDENAFPGLYVLSVQGGKVYCRTTFADGSGGDQRHLMKEVRAPKSARRWESVHSEGPLGVFKADGVDTDRLTIELHGDRLHVFADLEKAPWFVGSVIEPLNVSLLPARQ